MSSDEYHLLFSMPVRIQGTIAPWAMERLRLGMMSSGSSSMVVPMPMHSGQAPCGALKEKLRGSSSPMLMPQ